MKDFTVEIIRFLIDYIEEAQILERLLLYEILKVLVVFRRPQSLREIVSAEIVCILQGKFIGLWGRKLLVFFLRVARVGERPTLVICQFEIQLE